MGELRFAAALLFWGLLPGFILLKAARVPWSAVECAAAAPGLSIAAVAFAAYAAEVVGLPIAPLPVAALLASGVVLLAWLGRGIERGVAYDVPEWPFAPSRLLRWAPWLVFLVPLGVVLDLQTITAHALLPPSLHDGLDHANWFRLILETGSLNPREVAAPPLGPAGEPAYYPWGMHAWAALLARASGMDPVAVWMRAMVFISAAVPLSIYVFAAHFAGRGWAAMTSALFGLVFWWLPYQVWSWGGYALLAGAVAALPVARLMLVAAEGLAIAWIALTVAAMGGLLFVHPSQLYAALIIGGVVSLTHAASGLTSWRTALVFVVLIAGAGSAIVSGGMLWEPVGDFLQRAREVSEGIAVDPRYRWPIATGFDTALSRPDDYRTGMVILCAAGAIAAAIHPRLRPLLALHVTFAVAVLIARHQTWVTALWYHLPERIWYAQIASQPVLAALGIGAILVVAARIVRRWIDLPRWQAAVWVAAAWFAFTPIAEAYDRWADWRLYHAVYRNPHFSITDRRVLADFAWMQAHVPPREVLFNAPSDWGLPLPFSGHRTVYWSGGYAFDPATPWNDWFDLTQRPDPDASQGGAELSARGINYVYAARLDPSLERRGRRSLDPDKLRAAAAFTEVYASPTASVFQLANVRPSLLGLHDSRRIRYSGFHPLEELGRRRWRWTNGAGKILLTTAAGAGSCFVRVLGPAPGTFTVLHAGRRLELTARGFPVAPAGSGAIELEIVSPTFVPDPEGGDTRTLGVRVTDIAFTCVD